MCGRFTLRVPLGLLVDQFLATPSPQLELSPRYNAAPTQQIAVVRLDEGKRQLTTMRWGLIPFWAKDTKVGFSGINARGDTVATKPAFRAAYKKRRCLVLADGYYEWKAEGKAKLPFLYEVDGGKPFAFAGLWEVWRGPDKDGEPLESCTIITTDANKLAANVHDRMPVILDPPDYDPWLDTKNEDVEYMLDQLPADRMCVRPVSTYVNNVKNQGPECVAAR